MQQVKAHSYTDAKATYEYALPLLNVYQVFVTVFQLALP
jgi:hypothetical protein